MPRTKTPRTKIDTSQDVANAGMFLLQVRARIYGAVVYARQADAPQIVKRLRSDLKAIDGALRHVEHRLSRIQAGSPMRRRGCQPPGTRQEGVTRS